MANHRRSQKGNSSERLVAFMGGWITFNYRPPTPNPFSSSQNDGLLPTMLHQDWFKSRTGHKEKKEKRKLRVNTHTPRPWSHKDLYDFKPQECFKKGCFFFFFPVLIYLGYSGKVTQIDDSNVKKLFLFFFSPAC